MDQLFMFSNEYTTDDAEDAANGSSKKETKIKNEPEEVADDGGDNDSYIMPESLLQQMTSTPDAEGEDDNTIFNFGIEPTADKRQSSSLSKPYNSKNPQDAFVNYDIAIMYICPACGSEFDTQSAWKGHINGVHQYNTRRGLNFIPIDKLYHKCLECSKPIAMHAMENLLKHKFTHLPHRCTKCKLCHRLYKYRQDLIVHLRLCHREEVLSMMGNAKNNSNSSSHNNSRATTPALTKGRLEIRDIKGNAVDIFENTNDSVEVKNEPFDPDEQDGENLLEQTTIKSKFPTTSILEDALSRSSSQVSDQRQSENANINERKCEKHIQYICPVCSTEFTIKNDWLSHVQEMHNFCTINGLGFRQRIHSTVECLECKKVMSDKSIEQLQLHKFSHLPCKAWVRCKLCFRTFNSHKDIVKHLLTQHRLDNDEYGDVAADESQDGGSLDPYSAPLNDNDDDQALADEQGKSDIRDIYETQIDYLCPKCGKEFFERKMWRKHIVKAHHYTDLKTLCFVVLNEHQLQCRLCGKIITNAYGVQNAQQHYFTHLPHKAYIRCRICTKSYTDRKGLVKHLRKVHHINPKTAAAAAIAAAANKNIRPQSSFQQPQTPSQVRAPRTAPVKEIVSHNGVIYEIQFLDEGNNDEVFPLNDSSSLFGEGRNDDSFAMPTKRHVCPDCYSTFSTAQALQKHTREQHDFKKPSQAHVCSLCYCTFESGGALQDHKLKHHMKNSRSTIESENNDDDDLLLIPTGNEDVKTNSNSGAGAPSIEQYFCYLCPACGEEFKSQYEWRRHINDIHYFDRRYELNFSQIDKFHFQCVECKEIVNSAKLKGLQDHKFRHLPYKLYIKCRLCSTCYNHKPNMITHLRIRHNLVDPRESRNSSPSMSPSPQMRFNTSSSYDIPSSTQAFNVFKPLTTEDVISNHNAVDHESITYRCPQCNEAFDTHALWRQHIVTAHDLNSRQGLNFRQLDAHHYICLECYKRVTVTHTKGAIGQLQSHKFRHLPYKSFCCTKCNGLFVRKQMFFKHLNRTTNRCPLLGNERVPNFNTKAKGSPMSLARPLPGNSGNSGPTKHLNFSITSKEKCPYIIQCPQCGIKFEKWHPWREHIEKVHALHSMASLKFKKINDHLHICIQCKERVTGANFINLQTHRFKHLPYGTYLHCRYCDVRYYYMINIIKHMKQKHPNHGMEQLELQVESRGDEVADPSPATVSMEVDKECEGKEKKDTDNAANDDNQEDEDNAVIIDDDQHENKTVATKDVEYGFGCESSICSYIIQCPQCGIKYDNWHLWQDHIASAHSLHKHDELNFTKIFDWLEECNECKERVNATSLVYLQTHKFKHLPYGMYLQCRYCEAKFNYMINIVRHLKSKHPEHALQQLDQPSGLADVLPDNENEMNEEKEEEEETNAVGKTKEDGNGEIDVDAEGDDDEEEEEEDDDDDDDDDDDEEDDDANDVNNGGEDFVERMDVDDKSEDDFEEGEEDDDENDDNDDDDEDDDDEIENYANVNDVEEDPAIDSGENTNIEVPRGAVEDIEEVDEPDEQFVLG